MNRNPKNYVLRIIVGCLSGISVAGVGALTLPLDLSGMKVGIWYGGLAILAALFMCFVEEN